jgi:co-chaperonin GroES (HSP10)
MKAVGNNIIIKKLKEGTTETKGGLLLAENQRDDIRYTEATVVRVGELVQGIKESDSIFFDRHAGHKIEYSKETYHIIKNKDVVVVL